jgi:hypothetical protein
MIKNGTDRKMFGHRRKERHNDKFQLCLLRKKNNQYFNYFIRTRNKKRLMNNVVE